MQKKKIPLKSQLLIYKTYMYVEVISYTVVSPEDSSVTD